MREEEEKGELSVAGLIERQVSGLSVCYLSRSSIYLDQTPESEGMQRSEDEKKRLCAPKVYVLQPWILKLLMKYGQLDPTDPPLPGHVLKVVSDLKATDPVTAAVLHLSDGSYYIRVVVTAEAAKCAQLQSGFSRIIGKIIVVQKYTVCFQEETKAEECEFYLLVQRFLVLPLQRQRMESLNCNKEPSILQKIKELWQKGLSLKTVSSSETSVSQLMIDMEQSQLKVLKQNVEECLDLLDPSAVPAIRETLPVSKWVAERKRELSKDIFTVPANVLVICPEKEVVIQGTCLAEAPQSVPVSSSNDRDLEDHSIVSCPNDPGAMSRSWDMSLDNPWDKLQSVSITLSSSLEERSLIQPNLPSTHMEEVAITQPDSNTPDFLEPPIQKSPCSLSQDEPAETLSPSLLSSHSSISLSEPASQEPDAAQFQMAPEVDKAPDASCTMPCGQPSAPFQPSLCLFSPELPILGNITSRACHTAPPRKRGQTDVDGKASPLAVENSCLRNSECDDELGSGAGEKNLSKSGKHMATKRKLLVECVEAHGEVLPNPDRTHRKAQRKPSHADGPRERAKKSRMELAKPAQKPALPSHPAEPPGWEDETASARSMPASCEDQPRAQQQKYIKGAPFQYIYKAPSPELCIQVKSTRISKAMLRWACWVVTKAEQSDS